jgi:hypothetical protein
MTRFNSIHTESRARLAQSFASFALRAQRRAAIAKAVGDTQAWARHMRRASQLAHKADMLGA